ncbi:hypothetical protein ACFL38_02660 [Candidatus Omnitrophota bacterium]
MKRMSFIVLILCTWLSTVSAAEFTHPDGMKVEYPNSWTQRDTRTRTMFVSPEGDVTVLLFQKEVSDLDVASRMFDEELTRTIRDSEITDGPTDTDFNGIEGLIAEGVGSIAGRDVQWVGTLTVYYDKAYMLVGFTEQEAFEYYEVKIREVVNSMEVF